MKDLYRRNDLSSGESNPAKIHAIDGGFQEDREAAFAVFLNEERKKIYDATHETLKIIGRLRTKLDLNSEEWKKNNPDYVELAQDIESDDTLIRSSKKKNTDRVFGDDGISPTSTSGSAFSSSEANSSHHSTEHKISENFKNSTQPKISRLTGWFTPQISKLTQRFAWVFGVGFFGIMMWLMFSEEHAGIGPEIKERDYKHIAVNSVNAYSSPSETATVIDTLSQYDDVVVITKESIADWDFVELGEEGAYILKAALGDGKGERALVETCRVAGVNRPETSELSLYRPTGIHKLIISNPPGKDTILKMKSSRGKTSLIAYVRGGENFVVENIAEGDYYFEFSIGENYGPACGRFLDEAYAIRDQEPKYFTAIQDGFERLPRTISYVLKNEIFNTKKIPMRHF